MLAGAVSPLASEADLCRDAVRSVSLSSGVPADVLLAITLTETGRDRGNGPEPWPWAVNHAGESYWFPDRPSARDYVADQLARGETNLDIGCFQLNHRWHGDAFASIDAMFDPVANATYAAAYLTRLEAGTGDWSVAAGAYHSRTEANATRYRNRFDAMRVVAQTQTGQAPGHRPYTATARDFPLFRPGTSISLGSLVPLAGG
jgi:hypothetical protein